MGSWSLAPLVKALRELCGVGLVIAATLVTKIGDLSRFRTLKQFMGWLGLVSSETSSGTRCQRGAITKAGNGEARAMLDEAAWYNRFRRARSLAMVVEQLGHNQKKRPDRGILCLDRAAWVRTIYATNLLPLYANSYEPGVNAPTARLRVLVWPQLDHGAQGISWSRPLDSSTVNRCP